MKKYIGQLLLAVIIVGIMELAMVSVFRFLELKSSRASTSLFQLQADANRMDALEWKAIALGRTDPELQTVMDKLRAEVRDNLAAFEHDNSSPAHVVAIGQACQEYLKAVDLEFSLLRLGALDEARQVDTDRVDPAFERWRSALEQGEVYYAAHVRRLSTWDERCGRIGPETCATGSIAAT